MIPRDFTSYPDRSLFWPRFPIDCPTFSSRRSEQVHLLAVEIGECFFPLVPQYDYTLYQSVNPLSTLYHGDNV